jgi:hypothetical protein
MYKVPDNGRKIVALKLTFTFLFAVVSLVLVRFLLLPVLFYKPQRNKSQRDALVMPGIAPRRKSPTLRLLLGILPLSSVLPLGILLSLDLRILLRRIIPLLSRITNLPKLPAGLAILILLLGMKRRHRPQIGVQVHDVQIVLSFVSASGVGAHVEDHVGFGGGDCARGDFVGVGLVFLVVGLDVDALGELYTNKGVRWNVGTISSGMTQGKELTLRL